jgi:NhaC family Na+:H+ antiporter
MLYAFTGWFSPRATDEDRAAWKKSDEDVMDMAGHEHLVAAKKTA